MIHYLPYHFTGLVHHCWIFLWGANFLQNFVVSSQLQKLQLQKKCIIIIHIVINSKIHVLQYINAPI